jgi:hypothetical protein
MPMLEVSKSDWIHRSSALANLDMHAFPDLVRLMLLRGYESNAVRSSRVINPAQGQAIVGFWGRLADRIQEEDELSNMFKIVREVDSDLSMLRALHQSMLLHQGGPQKLTQLQMVVRLIITLLEIQQKLKYWHWVLRDRHLNFLMSINPAIPSKAKDKKQAKKDEKKKGKAQAKQVLDLGKKEKKENTKKKT